MVCNHFLKDILKDHVYTNIYFGSMSGKTRTVAGVAVSGGAAGAG